MAKPKAGQVKKVRSPAYYRVKERCRPISEEPIGNYLQVTTKNMAGNAFGKPCMSFEKPYKLVPDRLIVDGKDLARALHELHSRFILIRYETK